jgi:hypothetical protein
VKDATFIIFDGPSPSKSGKTQIWLVYTADRCMQLGEIAWFARWRCYAFYPSSYTAFEQKCLRDIASFCEAQTAAHREARTNRITNRMGDHVRTRPIALLCILALAILTLPACHDGGRSDDASTSIAPPVVTDVTSGSVFSCTSFITYPDGGHTITPNPRFAELAPCVLYACRVAGVCYYGCPRELIDRQCPGAR